MKLKKIIPLLYVVALLINQSINAQETSECIKYINYYNEHLSLDNYDGAIHDWRKAYYRCPVRIGHKFYSDGADIYRHLAVESNNPSYELLDTLVLLNAVRGYLYPQYQNESLQTIMSDINRFSSGNEKLRLRLLDKINNAELFVDEGNYVRQSRVTVISPKIKSGGSLTTIENAIIKGEISKEISRSEDYVLYTRTDIDPILQEYDFQNFRMVSENERFLAANKAGVDNICVIDVTKEESAILIEAALINLNSGEILSSSMGYCEYSSIDDSYALEITCKKIGQELTGASSYKRIKLIPSKNTIPRRGKPYIETAFGTDMKLVYINGGVYNDGTENVEYIEPFYISTLLVTQAQWTNVMGISQEELLKKHDLSSEEHSNGDKYPVFCITYQEALDFCKSLSSMSGLNYSLPTAAEWEMAANRPYHDFYYSGSNKMSEVGWDKKPMPVGLKRANSYGLYDMTGNVAEFCVNGNDIVLKAGKPWGTLDVSTQYTFIGVTEHTASPYIGFRVVMRVPDEK